jgi:hypothetical protein
MGEVTVVGLTTTGNTQTAAEAVTIPVTAT